MKPVLSHSLCALALLCAFAASCFADDWPQWRGPNRDGIWRETGIRATFEPGDLKPKWTAPIGPGFSGPTVAAGRVYLTDRQGNAERVLCFESASGKPVWDYSYQAAYNRLGGYACGPRASVLIHDGLAYALGAMGHLHCLDAATGAVIWKLDLAARYQIQFPIWGIASSPIIQGDLILMQIGGADSACLVALDRKTGAERWKALDDQVNYSAPIAVDQAGRRIVIFWTGNQVVGINPADGTTCWRQPFPHLKMPLGIATPVISGDRLFVSGFYDGSLMLRLPAGELKIEKLWQRRGKSERNTDALHSIISTPILKDNVIYGVDSYGEFRALDAATGDRIWQDDSLTPHARWSTIHMVQQPAEDRVWMFNETGELMITHLSPRGVQVISRAKLLPSGDAQAPQRSVNWSHPAFARRCIFARNDDSLICVDLAAKRPG